MRKGKKHNKASHTLWERQEVSPSPAGDYKAARNKEDSSGFISLSGLSRRSLYRGSHMSAHVLLNLLNELGKRDKMRGLPSILSLFRNEFNKFNNTRARMLDSIYQMTLSLLWNLIFAVKNVIILSLCTQRRYRRHNVSRKSINH